MKLTRTLSAARLATPARTRAPRAHGRRPATNDTTCGPPEWLTGKLHDGGTRSVRSPARRPPPSLRRLSPLPCKAAAPKGPAFCFLNYLVTTLEPWFLNIFHQS